VHVTPIRICQRAVIVVDQDNVVRYVEYTPEIGQEVDFSAALAAAKALV
jgi:thioredoxin-dependent peroxiredoxin